MLPRPVDFWDLFNLHRIRCGEGFSSYVGSGHRQHGMQLQSRKLRDVRLTHTNIALVSTVSAAPGRKPLHQFGDSRIDYCISRMLIKRGRGADPDLLVGLWIQGSDDQLILQ